MKKSLEIFKLILRLWFRSIGKVLKTKVNIILVCALGGLLVFIAGLAGYKLTSTMLNSFINGDMRSLYLLAISMFLNSSIFVFMFFVFFKSITPEQNQFTIQLNWFPLKRYERNLGYHTPLIIIISFLVLFIDCIVLIPSFISSRLEIEIFIFFFVFLFLQILFISFCMNLLYNVFKFIVLKLKLPFQKFITLLIVMIISSYYMISNTSINGLMDSYMTFDYNLAYFMAPSFIKSVGKINFSDANILVIFSVFLLISLLYFLSMFLSEESQERTSSKALEFIPIPKKNKFFAIVVKEIKTQARSEENVLNFLIFVVIGLFLRFMVDISSFNSIIMLLLSGFCGMIALNSFGNDQRYYPVYKIFNLKSLQLMLSKTFAQIILAFSSFLFITVIVLNLQFDINSLEKNILVLANSTVLFYIMGLLLPVGYKNPYMGILSFSILIFVLLPIVFILSYILGDISKPVITVLTISAELVLCSALYFISNWRFRNG